MDQWVESHLACPDCRARLHAAGDQLACEAGHRFPVVDGIPVLLPTGMAPTHAAAVAATARRVAASAAGEGAGATPLPPDAIHPHVQSQVAATSGFLYKPLIGRLTRYPIPVMRLPPGEGRRLLDVGCNWGRWCLAAARQGYRPVGVDPSLEGVLAARDVARQLGVEADFVVGDGRRLPFADGSFDAVFSYSVLQHFSKPDARATLAAAGRVLRAGGTCLVQMPNVFGVRCLWLQALRGFREPHDFEVRYWTPGELRAAFTEAIGPSRLSIDGFFGLGIQASDVDLLLWHHALVVRCSEALRRLARVIPPLLNVADSLYVEATRREDEPTARPSPSPA